MTTCIPNRVTCLLIFGIAIAPSAASGQGWTHHNVAGQGGYDFPIITFWDGTGWSAAGTVPDPRRETDELVVEYNCYAWESTGHGRDRQNAPTEPYSQSDLTAAVQAWHTYSGYQTRFYNDFANVTTDGSAAHIQVLVAFATGTKTVGSPHPACEGQDHNNNNAVFAVAFPPGFNASRSIPYPVLFHTPGSGKTGYEVMLGKAGGTPSGLLAQLVGRSVQSSGKGLIVLVGNAGGQGSHGHNSEYRNAVNEMMQTLQQNANADLTQVVTWGGSRGGSNALLHGSRSDRNYSVVGAFAAAPPVLIGSLGRLKFNFLPLDYFYHVNSCFADPDCVNAWRWDHSPNAPATEPNLMLQSLLGVSTVTAANQQSAWTERSNWDQGAWVEICTSPRDYVSGMGLARYYHDALPPHVDSLLNIVFGGGHGGWVSARCAHDLQLFVLDRVVQRTDYAGQFAQQVQQGIKLHKMTLDDACPHCFEAPGEVIPIAANTGCGTVPAVAAFPWRQQLRPADGAIESSNFMIMGDPGRKWRVELLSAPQGQTVIHSWDGITGSSYPAGCEAFPRTQDPNATVCFYQDFIDQCTGPGDPSVQCSATCGWRFWFDCNGDGALDRISDNWTPFVGQPAAELQVLDVQCKGFHQCTHRYDGLHPEDGFPTTVSSCLRMDTDDCQPAQYGTPDAGPPVDASVPTDADVSTDTEPGDMGPSDTSPPDTSPPDTSPPDAGLIDARPRDLSPTDVTAADSEPRPDDAKETDSPARDMGAPDGIAAQDTSSIDRDPNLSGGCGCLIDPTHHSGSGLPASLAVLVLLLYRRHRRSWHSR